MVDIEKIKKVRLALELDQEEFGARMKIKQTTYSRYETGAKQLPKNFVKLFIPEFNVNPEWWETGVEPIFMPKDIKNIEKGPPNIPYEVLKIKLEHEETKSKWYSEKADLLQEKIEMQEEVIKLLREQNKALKEKEVR